MSKKRTRFYNSKYGQTSTKRKVCDFCHKPKLIRKTISPEENEEGRQLLQCWDCGRREDAKRALSKKNQKKAEKKAIKKQIRMIAESTSRDKIEAQLDANFSVLIRAKHQHEDGTVTCYTCGLRTKFTNLQCGHFIPRTHRATRWLEENCRPQCKTCNEFKAGNLEVFEKKLEEEFPGLPEQLRQLGHQVVKHSTSDLRSIYSNIKAELAKLIKPRSLF